MPCTVSRQAWPLTAHVAGETIAVAVASALDAFATQGAAVVAGIILVGGAGNGVHNVPARNAVHSLAATGQHGRAFSFHVAVSRAASTLGHFGDDPVGAVNAMAARLASGPLAFATVGHGRAARKRARAVPFPPFCETTHRAIWTKPARKA